MRVKISPEIRSVLYHRACEQERILQAMKAWAVLCLVMAGGYTSGLLFVIVYPPPHIPQGWLTSWVILLPALIPGVLGLFGLALSRHNTMMELTRAEKLEVCDPRIWNNLPGYARFLLLVFGAILLAGIAHLLFHVYLLVT